MKANLVSILIPSFNSENYISEAIQSAVNQTYPHIEVIIVDDGSTDNSFQIAKSFESDQLKVYQQQQKGACAARNLAFEKSSGEYIQYLDADDLLTPNKIESQIKLFNEFGDKIITNCKWGRFSNAPKKVKWEHQFINHNFETPTEWITDSWMGKGMAQTAVWLTTRHLIEKAGPWDESLTINQDGEFFSRVLMQAEAIKFSEDAGVYYRSEIVGSITQNKNQSKTKAESLLKSYQSYEKVLAIKDNEDVRKALGNNYLNFIYQFYNIYPDLATKAEKYFYTLGLKKMWPVGGYLFKKICFILGFKQTLWLKRKLFS